jgi:hypothetical protein
MMGASGRDSEGFVVVVQQRKGEELLVLVTLNHPISSILAVAVTPAWAWIMSHSRVEYARRWWTSHEDGTGSVARNMNHERRIPTVRRATSILSTASNGQGYSTEQQQQ